MLARIILVLLFPVLAYCAPNTMTSFDALNADTTTATDVMDLATIETATDADVRAGACTDNSQRCHNALNGGASGSLFAGIVDLASGERGGWESPTLRPFSADQGCIGFAVHQHSGGGVSDDRVLAQWVMSNGQFGCQATLNESEQWLLKYQAGASIGTANVTQFTNACSNDTQRGCDSDDDCVSPGTCTTCSTVTGEGCFWPYVELCQENFPSGTGDRVRCRLFIGGSREIDSGIITAANLASLADYEVGGVGTESATASLAFDDIIATDATRVGNSYLHWMTPSAINTLTITATEDSCGSGTTYLRCINDWIVSPFRLTGTGLSDTLRANAVGRGAQVSRFTTQPTAIPESATIPNVGIVFVGRTSDDAGTWTTGTRIITCTSATDCDAALAENQLSHGLSTTPIVVGNPISSSPPGAGGVWTLAILANIGASWNTVALPSSANLRLGAVGVTAHVRRADALPTENLLDHNLGTDDTTTVCAITGDSTFCGTGASTCQGGSEAGQACNQPTFCSWDSTNESKPPGGCTTDVQCQSCEGRRTEFADGAGYACVSTAGTEPNCDLGTCSGGFCTGDGDVACPNGNSDCQLGTCNTTATCEESCPGGSCPARSGVPFYTSFVCDSILNCCQDGINTEIMVDTHGPYLLWGRSSLCQLVAGVSGQCQCSSDSECQASASGVCDKSSGKGRCSTAPQTTCTVDGNCTGGTCLGLCTASDNNRNACTGQLVAASNPLVRQCATDRACVWGPPDYLLMGTGINDIQGSGAYNDANCEAPYQPGGFSGTFACDNCAETPCVADATCTAAITANAQCFGVIGSTTTFGCFGPQIGELGCTTDTAPCRVDTTCRTGQTCTGETGGTERDGICTCDGDEDCLSGYECHSTLCRKTCTVNGDCGAAATCNVAGVCNGQCSCPCNVRACTTNADCPEVTVPFSGSLTPHRSTKGTCVGGFCDDCYINSCASTTATRAFRMNYARWTLATYQAVKYRELITTMKGYGAGEASSSLPLIIPMTFPDGTAAIHPTCEGGSWMHLATMSQRSAVQLRREFPHVIDVRPAVQGTPDATVYVDIIHPGVDGGAIWADPINDYMQTLRSCRTGTGADSVLARYCRESDGDWRSPEEFCEENADCANASDTCAQRICTVDDDTSAGCPGAPTCHLEVHP